MKHKKNQGASADFNLQPKEDLVLARLPGLRRRLQELIEPGLLHLTIDLSAVELVDSSGIGLLVATYNSLKKIGASLEIINASSDSLHLFQAVRLHQHLRITGRV